MDYIGQWHVQDFTCSDTFAAKYINQTKADKGAAAELAVKRKHAKYSEIKSKVLHLTVIEIENICGKAARKESIGNWKTANRQDWWWERKTTNFFKN